MTIFIKAASVLAFSVVFGTSAMAQSLYGCHELEHHPAMPALEGTDGVYYRVLPDMQNFHPLSVETADLLAEFSNSLAEKNIKLIMAIVPTKSLSMPTYLTSRARDFGFDLELATTNYDLMLKRLDDVNVANANIRAGFQAVGESELVMYRTDYRLTALGARLMAETIGEIINGYGDGANTGLTYSITQVGTVEVDSAMRNNLQQNCRDALPKDIGGIYDMTETGSRNVAGSSNLLDTNVELAGIALIGTEYTAEPTSNLSGFLAQATGMEVQHYAVPGGGAFAAMSSYITSDAFRRSPPAYLVWEVPMYYNLAQYSDAPLRELTGAAREECRVAIQLNETDNPLKVTADLSGLNSLDDTALQLDAPDTEANAVRFHLKNAAGSIITRSIYRNADQRRTGRFFLPLNGLPDGGPWSVEIELDASVGERARLTGCYF